ncbi:MAG: branched-chain amino acid ABC transporter permease, partial [Desulfobacteraceae bacterium]|nr:branched-chain amino acid ABC transporter permease [Desulfobacteraceae bacterium]
MDATVIIQLFVSGLTVGLLYALVAIGLTLIWGVTDIINFAHGEFLVIAMYFGFFTYSLLGVSSILAMPVAVVFLGALGWIVYRYVIARVLKSENILSQIVVTFGISIFLQSLFLFLFTGDYRSVDNDPWIKGDLQVGGIFSSTPEVITSILSLVVIFFLNLFIKKTYTGKAIIATSLDRETAQLMGINTERMNSITFALGIACLGVGGVVLPITTHVSPYSGFLFAVLAFTIVALGGFGSVVGTILAGVIVGMIQTFGGFFIEPAYKY